MIKPDSDEAASAVKKKILLLEFKHETNVFTPAPADAAANTTAF